MSLANLHTDNRRALTFSIGDSLFGIDVSHILSFSDSFSEIKYASDNIEGFVGYLDFRNTLVQVFECATSLSHNKERDSVSDLVEDVKTYQQAHIDWVNALEHSITSGEPFTKPRNPRMCAFGQWFYSFQTEDSGLRTLLDKIEEPHQHIHSLADTLLDMTAAGKQAQAINELQLEKQTTLKKLLRVLDYIRDYLENSIHPIVLHLTKDGRTPWFSMVLDNIGDIIDYPPMAMDTLNSIDKGEPVKGYVRDPSGVSFMMLALDKFYEQANAKISKAG
ncbi:CZB domain-containing protein [Neptuniibacter halophilus]|uniref:CZB domain-containing protein n=1 Tax=Neptuniibacter halophilus TaxID=651666 RepID=UPI0025748C8F|nr:CZB domain-containing protein [Neptuniibacter halophilus]